jgi:hypothetical protein
VSVLTTSQVAALTTSQVRAIETEDVAVLTSSQVKALTTGQVFRVARRDQVVALTLKPVECADDTAGAVLDDGPSGGDRDYGCVLAHDAAGGIFDNESGEGIDHG